MSDLQVLTVVDASSYTNLLFIDQSVNDYQDFITYANPHTYTVSYSSNSSREGLLGFLKRNFISFQRIGMVFTSIGPLSNPFLDSQPFFRENESVPYSENVQFVLNLIKEFGVKNIDYLGCNTLQYPNWVNYYSILSEQTDVVVGASNDATGNIKYGGDWVMESTGEDIELVYFTSGIEYHKYLLDLGFSSFVIRDGTVYGTGNNSYGQLGIGNTTQQTTLTAMTSVIGKNVKAISCGGLYSGGTVSTSHTIVLMTDGTVYGTGNNTNGQIGNGTNTQRTTLTAMTSVSGKTPVAISCGTSHTIVLMTDGSVYGTGFNGSGQLGNGNTTQRTTLTAMTPVSGKTVKSISCGTYYTIVLMTDGTVYGTGSNGNGQLGIGNTTQRTTLTAMTPVSGKTVKAISCGGYYTIVLMSDGSVYGTGSNGNGQLGDGTNTQQTTLTAMTSVSGKTVNAISCGGSHTILLMTDGSVYGTGFNGSGQLGNGNNTNKNTLTAMTPVSGKTVNAISCGDSHTIVLMSDGTVYGTGLNSNGQLGNGNNTNKNTLTYMTIGDGSTPVTYVNNIFDSNYTITIFINLNNQPIIFDNNYNASLNLNYTNDISGTYKILDASANLNLSLNNIYYSNIASPFDVPLQPKDNSLNFLLTSNGNTQNYRVNLYIKNNDVRLKQFDVSGIPVSDGSNVNLPFGTSSVSVVATPTDASANRDISGNTGLVTGDNSLNITVTAEDPSYNRIYHVNLHVEPDVSLNTFKITSIKSDQHSENVIHVPYGTTDVSINYTTLNAKYEEGLVGGTTKIFFSGTQHDVSNNDPSGGNTFSISRLQPFYNDLSLTVFSATGLTSKTFGKRIYVESDELLTNLTVDGINFTNGYIFNIPYGLSHVTLTFDIIDLDPSISSYVIITVNGKEYGSQTATETSPFMATGLVTGINNITLLVSSQDNLTQKTYHLTVYVEASCLLEGTLVWTANGYVPIETLKVGDSIRTKHFYIDIVKVGKWSVDLNQEEDRNDLSKKMYKIPAGQYGATSDTYISHYHRILVDENPGSETESRVYHLPTKLGLGAAEPTEVSMDHGKYNLYHLQLAVGNHFVVNGGCMVESWKPNAKHF